MTNKFTVIKASGVKEAFSEKKVRRSIRRAGIAKELEDQVVEHVKSILYQNIPTSEIYGHIIEYLSKSKSPYTGSLYSLKQAIMRLGPSGFPFEKYMAQVFKHHNYQVQTGVVVSGECVEHEIDIIAEKQGERYMIECKFHNQPGSRSDVKVALYVQARFEDLQAKWEKEPGSPTAFHQPWLVTNTKFTSKAIAYGKCIGMKVVGWNHPKGADLQSLIEEAGLHPITCLSNLEKDELKSLLARDIVLCRQLIAERDLASELGMDEERSRALQKELAVVCPPKTKK